MNLSVFLNSKLTSFGKADYSNQAIVLFFILSLVCEGFGRDGGIDKILLFVFVVHSHPGGGILVREGRRKEYFRISHRKRSELDPDGADKTQTRHGGQGDDSHASQGQQNPRVESHRFRVREFPRTHGDGGKNEHAHIRNPDQVRLRLDKIKTEEVGGAREDGHGSQKKDDFSRVSRFSKCCGPSPVGSGGARNLTATTKSKKSTYE